MTKEEVKKGQMGPVGFVTGLVILGIVAWIWNSSINDEPGSGGAAQVACEDAVTSRLKAPSTADFSAIETNEIADKSWTVTGSVDSENGFGAAIRSSFQCTVVFGSSDSDSTVRVDSLS